MTEPTLPDLLDALEARQHTYSALDAYYTGTQPLAFLSPEAREALGSRFGRMATNLPKLAVTALAERLRIVGFRRNGAPDPTLWSAWTGNDLDQLAPVAHREALALGRSYVLCWAGPDGSPRITVESARQVAAVHDPATRSVVAAVKRWETTSTTEAVAYFPDRIVWHRATQLGATTGFRVVETIDNPLGVVPVVPLVNADRLLDDGVSEMADLIPLVDGLNKTLADMLVGSEFYARPRRWATGIELVDGDDGEENPFPEGDRMMIAEPPEAKFGSLPAADLAAYESAVNVLLAQVMAVSALPAHYVGITTENPASADAIRSAEASLTARAAARQATFGRSWERVAQLATAVANGVDPDGVDCSVIWADPSTRSVAQEADAVVKLHAAGILPATYALARLGYTAAEVEEIRAARRTDALDGAGVDLSGVLP
jgi:hypothetical protein